MKIERCPTCRCAPPCRCLSAARRDDDPMREVRKGGIAHNTFVPGHPTGAAAAPTRTATARRLAVQEPARGIEPRPPDLRSGVDTANPAGTVAEYQGCTRCAELEAKLALARAHIVELDVEVSTLRDELRRSETISVTKSQPVTNGVTDPRDDSPPAVTKCAVCDEPLPIRHSSGRHATYCSPKCRTRAYRSR